MKTKKFLIGFIAGVAVWYLLMITVNLLTTNGNLYFLTYLTEFCNKILFLVEDIFTRGLSQSQLDSLNNSSLTIYNLTTLLNGLVYGLVGGIISCKFVKNKEKVKNG